MQNYNKSYEKPPSNSQKRIRFHRGYLLTEHDKIETREQG